jgi:hypothetical protein
MADATDRERAREARNCKRQACLEVTRRIRPSALKYCRADADETTRNFLYSLFGRDVILRCELYFPAVLRCTAYEKAREQLRNRWPNLVTIVAIWRQARKVPQGDCLSVVVSCQLVNGCQNASALWPTWKDRNCQSRVSCWDLVT